MSTPLLAQALAHVRAHGATPDVLLDAFLAFVTRTGRTLYPAQEEALLELFSGHHVVLQTPTGSGKSLVALGLMFQAFVHGQRGVYTCPIKALVNEKFFDLCGLFGSEAVGLATGDATVNPNAPIVCCTAEVLMSTSLRGSASPPEAVVMDEFHYYADKERGTAWQVPLLCLERTQFLLMSATLGDTQSIETSLAEVTSRRVASVLGTERPVPLSFRYAETPLHETVTSLVQEGLAPVYVVHFTQRAASEEAQAMTSWDLTTRPERDALRSAVDGARWDTPFGKDVRRALAHGIGIHHAGMLPKYRRLVERLAQAGQLKVISGTDTLGVGVNVPIRTVLLTQLCKFDGEKAVRLSAREFHQISGRAGRKGFDDKGQVVAQAPAHVIENRRLAVKEAAGKKVVKQKAPTKGYVAWDAAVFERLTQSPPEPLASRFEVTHGLLLQLLQGDTQPNGYRQLVRIIQRSHERPVLKHRHLVRARTLARSLLDAGVLEHKNRRLTLRTGLQDDFSLHHALSFFVLSVLPALDPAADTWALDVISVVESVLEDPTPVLLKQRDAAKTRRLEELKAEGVPFEERIAQLEEVEWPKPLRDFLYGHFDTFRVKHPWVAGTNVRPKSVARELLERFTSFNDYVTEYGLARSEGVLLRHLTQVYKTLVQTIPADQRTEALEERIAELRTLVRSVDRSLLEEWAGLSGAVVPSLPQVRQVPATGYRNERDFRARVRSEMHALLRALASKDYEAASALLDDGDAAWTPPAMEAAMAPFWAVHQGIRITADARLSEHTVWFPEANGHFRVTQRMLDTEGEDDWFFEVAVSREKASSESAALLRLLRIGT
ncbi:MAG: DEAD/DEAH box helicase [Myxococcaceae bacterium]